MNAWRIAAAGAVMAGGFFVAAGASPTTLHTATSASQPTTAKAAGPANLVTVKGITLTKTAKTEEEEEEQVGMHQGGGFTGSSSFFGGTSIDATGSPSELLQEVGRYLTGGGRVFFHGPKLPGNQYHLVLSAGGTADALNKLAAAFDQAFHVKVVREAREVDVLVLSVDPEKIKSLPVQKGFGGGWNSETSGDKSSATITGDFSELASFIESEVQTPVVNETKNKSRYSFKMEWSADKPAESLGKSLATLGVTLTPGKRKIDGIHVDPETPATQNASKK